MKYLKISPEYECSPLWVSIDDGKTYKNIEITNTPFEDLLKIKILDWAKDFETTLNQNYPPDSGFESLKREEDFEDNGICIWKDITRNYSDIFKDIIFKSYKFQKLYYSLAEYENDLKMKS